MKILRTHILVMALELWRSPSYTIPTIVFPPMFYLIFALPNADSVESSRTLMASFSAFAVLGVVFFQFCVLTAESRASIWAQYVSTLPVSSRTRFLAHATTALTFGLLTAVVTILVCSWSSNLQLSVSAWSRFSLALLLGALPFVFMGFTLGLFVKSKDALPISNLVYLPLSFAGGLWMPPQMLPETIQIISPWLPSRQYGEILWDLVLDRNLSINNVLALSAYGIFFLGLALWMSKRKLSQ